MADRPVLQLTACTYDKIASNTSVLNLDEMSYYMWIYTDPDVTSDCYFYEAAELDKENGPIIFADTFEQKGPSWIQVKTDFLDKEVGLHIYRLTFVDRITDDVFNLFFAYIIQDDNPDKPYVYMNRSDNKGCDQKHDHVGEGAQYVNHRTHICK